MAGEIVKIIDNTAKAIAAIDRAKRTALEAIGATAVGYAKGDSPVDTGRLRASIDHKVQGDAAYIGTNVEYAVYQEMGTSKMSAANNGRGFLRPAATEHDDEYEQLTRNIMRNA